MDFEAKGVSQMLAEQVSELIRTEMINLGKYKVLERKHMGKILQEQEFQQTGCTDISCAVQAGKLLSAQKMLLGSVMKLDEKIIINGRLIDVAKGNAEFAEQIKTQSVNNIYYTVKKFTISLSKKIYGDIDVGIIHEYHSPLYAGLASIIPVWSGSLNIEFNWLGTSFAIVKTTSLILWFSYAPDINEYREKKERGETSKMEDFATTCPLILLGVTIIDIIYSVASANNYNNEYGITSINDNKEISIAFVPRFNYFKKENTTKYESDGINIVLLFKF